MRRGLGQREGWLYIEHTEGEEGVWVPEEASEVKEQDDERVSNACVVYAVVAVGIDSDEGLVRL